MAITIPSVNTIFIVPTLIVLASCILSLEILSSRNLARGLTSCVMVAMWGTLLSTQQQMSAILSAILYCGAFIFLRKRLAWSVFWARVFVWGATFAALGVTNEQACGWWSHSSLNVFSHDLIARIYVVVLCTIFCEWLEALLLMYFSAPGQGSIYTQKRRAFQWPLSLVVSALHTLIQSAEQLLQQHGVSVWFVIGVILVVTYISFIRLWDRLRDIHVVFVVKSRKKRKSILYYSSSDVEVVQSLSECNL